MEIPNIRLRGIGLMPALEIPEVEAGDDDASGALRYERDAWFRVGGELKPVATRFYDRAALRAGNRLEGPAIVNQYDSTTVIPPGLSARIDPFGNIVVAISVLRPEMASSAAEEVAAS
jgi:N-methylhydantoinase A/oxoprolinase/acetone carboxylase beta subunit